MAVKLVCDVKGCEREHAVESSSDLPPGWKYVSFDKSTQGPVAADFVDFEMVDAEGVKRGALKVPKQAQVRLLGDRVQRVMCEVHEVPEFLDPPDALNYYGGLL